MLSYLRFFAAWPAFMMLVLKFLDDTITLKPVTDPIFDYGKSQFEIANSTLSDQGLKDAGVQDPQLAKSLGLFGFIVFGLFLLLIIWGIFKCFAKRGVNLGIKIKTIIEKKLFWSSFYRYLIISNLKLTYTLWGFLIVAYGFATTMQTVQTIGYVVGILALTLWPLFIMILLQKNQHKLEDPVFS